MKTKFIYSIFAVVMLFSCVDYLEKYPLDAPSNETFYSNQDEILLAVNACYNFITARVEWPWIPTSFLIDAVTDIQATRSNSSNAVFIKRGDLNSTSILSRDLWRHYYAGINRTNSLLENMHKAEAVSNPEIYSRIKAEARVIRAICYIELIEKFGDVPFFTEFIDVDEALELTRTSKSEILRFVYEELQEASENLPERYSNNADRGRVTKGSALGMKARAALYNGDWEIARKSAKDVIDIGAYRLHPSYRQLFTYQGEYSDEILLDCQFHQLQRHHNFHFFNAPRNSSGQSQNFPTEDLIASFECVDGKTIDESPLYDPSNPFVNRDPRLFGAVIVPRVWDGETIKTNGTVFNNYEFMSSKEILYDSDGNTILPTSLSQKERTVINQMTGAVVVNQEVTNAFSSFTGYVIYKYMDEANMSRPEQNYNNIILLRYADILLTYAEASIELNLIDQSVLDALNSVRARAYGNTTGSGTDLNASNYPKVLTFDQAELRKIVRRERKVELCFEGLRFPDLKRWGLLEKGLSRRVTYGRAENFARLDQDDRPVFDQDGFMTFPFANDRYGLNNEQVKLRFFENFGAIPETYGLLPIPLSEIELNPKLTQNPGY